MLLGDNGDPGGPRRERFVTQAKPDGTKPNLTARLQVLPRAGTLESYDRGKAGGLTAMTDQRRPHLTMLVIRPARERGQLDGAWWPQSRSLSTELAKLVAMWPTDGGRIERVRYALSDWDDQPDLIPVSGWTVRCGVLSERDAQTLTLTLSDRPRVRLQVIAAGASRTAARHAFSEVTGIYRALETRGQHDGEDWDGTFDLAGDTPADRDDLASS